MRIKRCIETIHEMASFGFLLLAITVLPTSFAVIGATQTQVPEGARASVSKAPPMARAFRAPRNLKVFPKNSSGIQVNDTMEEWSRSLGVRCDSCHTEANETIVADDGSNLNFADDSKSMKLLAREMYAMTEEINSIHIAKIEGSGIPVTCGTCHRGHISPEPFAAPSQDAQR